MLVGYAYDKLVLLSTRLTQKSLCTLTRWLSVGLLRFDKGRAGSIERPPTRQSGDMQ